MVTTIARAYTIQVAHLAQRMTHLSFATAIPRAGYYGKLNTKKSSHSTRKRHCSFRQARYSGSGGLGRHVAGNPREPGSAHGGFEELAKFFQIVTEPTRMELLSCIAERPIYVKDLAARTNLEPSLLSHHLRRMRVLGLVVYTREGKNHLYSAGPATVRVTLLGPGSGQHVLSLPRSAHPGRGGGESISEVKPPGLPKGQKRRPGA